MQINQLLYFIAVIDNKSFTDAAGKLHISQPSLSASIKRLEREIGFKLINRSERNISLTLEGERFYNESKKLSMHFQQLNKLATQLKESGNPNIKIGVIEGVKSWLSDVTKEFKEQNEDVFIQLLPVLNKEDIVKAFEHFNVHVAITSQYIDGKTISSIPIYEEHIIAILPKGSLISEKDTISLHDIKYEPLIISQEGYRSRFDVLESFYKEGIAPNIQFEIDRFEFVCNFVENGLGVALIPEKYAETLDNNKFEIKYIENIISTRSVYLSYDNQRYLSPATVNFINLVLKYFNKESIKQHLI